MSGPRLELTLRPNLSYATTPRLVFTLHPGATGRLLMSGSWSLSRTPCCAAEYAQQPASRDYFCLKCGLRLSANRVSGDLDSLHYLFAPDENPLAVEVQVAELKERFSRLLAIDHEREYDRWRETVGQLNGELR